MAGLAAAFAAAGLGRRPFWLDEAISVGATRQLIPTLRGTGGTMGLYYALLTLWSTVSSDRVWLRLLSLILAAAAVPVVHRVAVLVDGRRLGWHAAGTLALSWLLIRYAQEARSYALVVLLVSLSWWALVRAVVAGPGRPSRWWWRLFVATTVAGVLAQGLTGLQLLAQVGVLALAPEARVWLRRVVPVGLAVALTVLTLTVSGASAVADWVTPLSMTQVRELLTAFTGPTPLAQLVLAATMLIGAQRAWRRFHTGDGVTAWLHAVVVIWGLLPPVLLIGLSLVRPYLVPRYVIGSLPGTAILIGYALSQPMAAWRRAAWTTVVGVTLLAGQVSLHADPGEDWDAAAAFVRAESRAGDGLVIPDAALRVPLDYAWEPSAPPPLVPIAPTGSMGSARRFYPFLPPDQLVPAILRSAAPRIWIVDQRAGLQTGREQLLERLDSTGAFAVVADQEFDGAITVMLLERVG